ncbi:unnamed protein product [Heterobilharzia americana]|nr:unnamed protein product [Heterobilharzia americana]
MLNVLRSLPATENNDAFIVRFEDLITRLENYQFQNKKNERKDIKSQLRMLKEQQDRIQYLLDQTARDIQDSGSSAVVGESSSATQQSHTIFPDSASALISKFECLLSNENSQGCQKDVESIGSASRLNNLKPKQEPVTNTPNNDRVSTLQFRDSVDTEPSLAALKCEESTDLTTQFEMQMSELERLIEESERFDGMVKRLVLITRKAHLGESTKLLTDISKRFYELQMSFNSLRESYKSIQSEPQLSSELLKVQLSSFHEFLNSLSRNFDSTKECFYTIHHLVKATIEQQLSNGTLQDMDNSDEENSSVVPVSQLKSDTTKDVSTELSTSIQNNEPSEDVDVEFVTQKAYLTALQQRTAQEREEVARLLQQRDELAGRLASLKAAASRASLDISLTSGHMVESTPMTAAPEENKRDNSVTEISPDLFSSLEYKKRELQELKAQLQLLRKAEAKVTAFAPILQHSESKVDTVSEGSLDNKQTCSTPQSVLPKICPPRARFENNEDDISRPTNVTQFTEPSKNVSVSSALPSKTDSINFQQPEVICSDNTERLYVNMREARIQIEEQRDLHDRGTSAILNHVNSGTQKSSQHVNCSGASVATSQDRTTLATWGGSSPVPSCSSEASDNGDGVSVADSLPLILGRNPSDIIQSAPNRHSESEISTIAVNTSDIDRKPEAIVKRSSGKHGNIPIEGSNNNVFATSTSDDPYKLSLPQVGRSPSPPARDKNNSGDIQTQSNPNNFVDHRPNPKQNLLSESINTSASQTAGIQGHMVVAPTCGDFDDGRMSDLSCAIANDRIQRLESNVAQLYQVCRCLMLENSQLNAAITQLMLHNSSQQALPALRTCDPSTSSVGLAGFHHCQCNLSTPSYNQLLLTDSGASYQAMLYKQEHPSRNMPCTLGTCSRSSGVYVPTNLKDTDQLLINQIMQQQTNLSQLQSELHRLTRLQTEIKQSLLSNDVQLNNPHLSYLENPNVFAHLLPVNGGFLSSTANGSTGHQNTVLKATNSPQMLGNSFMLPRNIPVNNWSFVPDPNVYQYSKESTSSNMGQKVTVQTSSSMPGNLLPVDPSVNSTSPHGSSVSQNNLGFSRQN